MTKIRQAYIEKLLEYIETHDYRFSQCNTIEEIKDILHKIVDEIEE